MEEIIRDTGQTSEDVYIPFDLSQYRSTAEAAAAFNNATLPGRCYTMPLERGARIMAYLPTAVGRYPGYCPWKKYRKHRGRDLLYIADLTEPDAQERYEEDLRNHQLLKSLNEKQYR